MLRCSEQRNKRIFYFVRKEKQLDFLKRIKDPIQFDMRKITAILVGVFLFVSANSQGISGTVDTRFINSTYLKNTGGENPNRRISVYLPPGYHQSRSEER